MLLGWIHVNTREQLLQTTRTMLGSGVVATATDWFKRALSHLLERTQVVQSTHTHTDTHIQTHTTPTEPTGELQLITGTLLREDSVHQQSSKCSLWRGAAHLSAGLAWELTK